VISASVLLENGAFVHGDSPDTDIPWWSFTKTVIATAALALVRDGRLVLDEELSGRPYTLSQLLQHRAGLAEYGGLRAYHEAVARGDEPWPPELMLERVEAERLRFPPGQGWGYSNVGYWHVRRIIEEVAGESLGAALVRLVLEPLGIEGVRLAEGPADLDSVQMGLPGYHPAWVYHGLLVGPLREAALLLGRLMQGALLPPHLLARMREAHRLGGPVPYRPWREPGYGLGLMAGVSTFGTRVMGHSGGGPGSVVAVYHRPDATPARTTATFAPVEDLALVEQAAFGMLASHRDPGLAYGAPG
jgi:CubicO group peptidase (beta-lactamase class C family)